MLIRVLAAAAVLHLPSGVALLHAQLPPRAPSAPAPQAPPPAKPIKEADALKMLSQLEEIGKTLDEQKYGHNAKIIKELRDAGMSTDKSFALWMDCMKDVEYDQKGKTATEFSEWKRRQTKDPNRERDAELQLQVQWLAIVLMDCNAQTDSARNEAVTAAVQFLDTVVERVRKADGKVGGAAHENVLGSVFARHYKLDASVKRREGGAYVPADLDATYEKMILPFYRSSRQAANLMNAWQKRITQQTAIAESFGFVEAKEKFATEKLPELRWGQARELFVLGQEEPATATMLSLIKGNLGHKRASEWIAELTSLLKKEDGGAPAVPPPPAPAPSPLPVPVEVTPPPVPAPAPAPDVDPTKVDTDTDPTKPRPEPTIRPLKP